MYCTFYHDGRSFRSPDAETSIVAVGCGLFSQIGFGRMSEAGFYFTAFARPLG